MEKISELGSMLNAIADDCSGMVTGESRIFPVNERIEWFFLFNLGNLLNLYKETHNNYFIVTKEIGGILVTLKPV